MTSDHVHLILENNKLKREKEQDQKMIKSLQNEVQEGVKAHVALILENKELASTNKTLEEVK